MRPHGSQGVFITIFLIIFNYFTSTTVFVLVGGHSGVGGGDAVSVAFGAAVTEEGMFHFF